MPARVEVFPVEVEKGDEIVQEYGFHVFDGNNEKVLTGGESFTRAEDAWRAFRNATVAAVEALAEFTP